MRLPGKFFIAAWQRQSARWSAAVCPLHVYTLHPVAFVHFEPSPAALTWMLTRLCTSAIGCSAIWSKSLMKFFFFLSSSLKKDFILPSLLLMGINV